MGAMKAEQLERGHPRSRGTTHAPTGLPSAKITSPPATAAPSPRPAPAREAGRRASGVYLRVCAMRCRPECATGAENCVRACLHMADASGRHFDDAIRLACGSPVSLAQPAAVPADPRRAAPAPLERTSGALPVALLCTGVLAGSLGYCQHRRKRPVSRMRARTN
jgi:hypothetical protein